MADDSPQSDDDPDDEQSSSTTRETRFDKLIDAEFERIANEQVKDKTKPESTTTETEPELTDSEADDTKSQPEFSSGNPSSNEKSEQSAPSTPPETETSNNRPETEISAEETATEDSGSPSSPQEPTDSRRLWHTLGADQDKDISSATKKPSGESSDDSGDESPGKTSTEDNSDESDTVDSSESDTIDEQQSTNNNSPDQADVGVSSDTDSNQEDLTSPRSSESDDSLSDRLWDTFDPDSMTTEQSPTPSPAPAEFEGVDGFDLADGNIADTSTADEPPTDPSVSNDLTSSSDTLDRATAGEHILVLSDLDHGVTDVACRRLLSSSAAGPANLLFITFTQSASDRLQVCRQAREWSGGDVSILEIGTAQSTGSDTETTSSQEGDAVTIKRVSDPSDLSKIGIMANQLLIDWESNNQPIIVCLHSLTAMLQYVSSKQLFQFLDILEHRLSTLEATTHYHMNPDSHDDILIETFRPLFDSIVRVSRHGEIELL